jgi:hypothetical protein
VWGVFGLHYLALSIEEISQKRFLAFVLADGSSDNTVYDTRQDAIDHQHGDQNQYAYFLIPLARPGVPDCDVLLWYARKCYDRGYRPAGAHAGAGLILPASVERAGQNFLLYDDTKPRRR